MDDREFDAVKIQRNNETLPICHEPVYRLLLADSSR